MRKQKKKKNAAEGECGNKQKHSKNEEIFDICSGVMSKLQNSVIAFSTLVSALAAIALKFTDNKALVCFAACAVLGIVCYVYAGRRKKAKEARGISILCGVCLMGVAGAAFDATGLIKINIPIVEKLSGEKNEANRTQSAGQSLQSSMQERAIRSTEAPEEEYEIASEAEQENTISQREVLMEAGRAASLTGTEENYRNFQREIWKAAEECDQVSNVAEENSNVHRDIAKNSDKADRLSETIYNTEQKGFTLAQKRCELRQKNFELKPTLATALLMGNASLDCLCFMGEHRVKSKDTNILDISIYNRENVILYSDISAEGFLQAIWRADKAENYGCKEEAEYGLAQLFHRLGDVSEFFSKEDRAVALGIAAVFYSDCVVEDDSCYEDGLISERQYHSAEFAAIAFEKLDAVVKPSDNFFLEQSERYYMYALRNENMGESDRKRLEDSLQTVQTKLQQKQT